MSTKLSSAPEISRLKKSDNPIARFDRPQSLVELAVGHSVIAFENEELGWWEAMVLERDGPEFTLAWVGCPDQPTFQRNQYLLALLCPVGPAPSRSLNAEVSG